MARNDPGGQWPALRTLEIMLGRYRLSGFAVPIPPAIAIRFVPMFPHLSDRGRRSKQAIFSSEIIARFTGPIGLFLLPGLGIPLADLA